MNEWNIQSRAHACQVCQKSFVDKDHFHTVLQAGRHELLRQDICEACWKDKYDLNHAERKGFISHWHGVYQAPTAAAPEAIQKETAETLLRRLIDGNDPKHGPACYILAVMLERKRLLKIKEQIKRDGSRIFIYEHPKTGDLFTITDPNLQLNQLEEVQRDVADLLANGYNPPAATTPLAEPAAPAEPTPPSDAPVPAEAPAAVDLEAVLAVDSEPAQTPAEPPAPVEEPATPAATDAPETPAIPAPEPNVVQTTPSTPE